MIEINLLDDLGGSWPKVVTLEVDKELAGLLYLLSKEYGDVLGGIRAAIEDHLKRLGSKRRLPFKENYEKVEVPLNDQLRFNAYVVSTLTVILRMVGELHDWLDHECDIWFYPPQGGKLR